MDESQEKNMTPQELNELAKKYYSGDGVEKSYEKAIELWQKATEQGDAEAQNNLGVCYKYGYGVEQSYEKAIELFAKAAVTLLIKMIEHHRNLRDVLLPYRWIERDSIGYAPGCQRAEADALERADSADR